MTDTMNAQPAKPTQAARMDRLALAICVMLFAACAWHVRLRLRAAGKEAVAADAARHAAATGAAADPVSPPGARPR